jgi:hypothetical protein
LDFVLGPDGYRVDGWRGRLFKLDRSIPADPEMQEWLDGFIGVANASPAA